MNNNLHAKLNHLKLQLEVLREVFHQQLQIESWYCKLFHNKVNDIFFGHSVIGICYCAFSAQTFFAVDASQVQNTLLTSNHDLL